MEPKHGRPDDDVSSAPESGTVRDDTSGNNPSPPERAEPPTNDPRAGDDPSVAGEER